MLAVVLTLKAHLHDATLCTRAVLTSSEYCFCVIYFQTWKNAEPYITLPAHNARSFLFRWPTFVCVQTMHFLIASFLFAVGGTKEGKCLSVSLRCV
jgi:hypothetical protein